VSGCETVKAILGFWVNQKCSSQCEESSGRVQQLFGEVAGLKKSPCLPLADLIIFK
jgi:hypothetical protein